MRPADNLPTGLPLRIARDAEWQRFVLATPNAEHMLVSGLAHQPLGISSAYAAKLAKFLGRVADE